jgi:hypothetical protein
MPKLAFALARRWLRRDEDEGSREFGNSPYGGLVQLSQSLKVALAHRL